MRQCTSLAKSAAFADRTAQGYTTVLCPRRAGAPQFTMQSPPHRFASALFLLLTGTVAAQSPLAAPGTLAPDFVSRTIDQHDIRLADYRGKIVVLDFWATWCGPCQQAMPHVQTTVARYPDDVVALAVCTNDTREKFAEWLAKNAASYSNILFTCEVHERDDDDFDERASRKLYGVPGLPTQFVIDRDGKVLMRIVGYEAGDQQLEAGLARAGLPIDAAVAQAGEAQQKAALEDAAREAARAAAHPLPAFFPRAGALVSGAAIPDFEMLGADGKTFTLSSLRGKPVVFGLGWADIVPRKRLQDLAARYGHYGVRTQALMLFTARAEFDRWVQRYGDKYVFDAAVDPVGKFAGGDDATDAERMAFHATTIAGKMFGGGYPAMPIGMVVDGEGHFVGTFSFGEQWREGVANLLLRAGVTLAAEDQPMVLAPATAFAVAPPRPPESSVALITDGAVAPDFVALDRTGKEVRLADYRGKVIVLDFWATWCGPCKAALPHVQQLAHEYHTQDVVVIASCTSDERQAFLDWLDSNGRAYPDLVFVHDPLEKSPERASRRLYGVSGIPHQFVIGRDGKIAAQVGGYSEGEVLLDAALAKAGVQVEAAVRQRAAADQSKRDARARAKPAAAMPVQVPMPVGK